MTRGTPPRDVRERLSAGLAELLASSDSSAGSSSPATSGQQRRNLLLDRCGSDYRPLVELLLRVGRHGTEQALRELAPVSAAEWPGKRASLVARVTNDLFVPAELAAWAVDSWAVAVGALPQTEMDALHTHWRAEHRAAQATAQAESTRRAASATAPRAGVTGRGVRRGVRAGRGGAGSGAMAGGTAAGGALGAAHASTTRRPPRSGAGLRGGRSRGGNSPIPLPSTGRVITVMTALVALLAVVVIRASATRETPVDAMPSLPESTVALPTAAADAGGVPRSEGRGGSARASDAIGSDVTTSEVTTSDALRSDPQLLALNREVIRRAAIGSSAEDVGPVPRPVPTPSPLPGNGAIAADLDTVVMDDGGMLVGSIRLVAPNDLFIHDVSSGLEYALPRARIARVVTHTGADLTNATRTVDSARKRPGGAAPALIAAGIGGSYRVEQRVRSVVGNSLCAPVAEALERDVIRTVEEILHDPGSREFELLTRPGVSGRIERNGQFTTKPFAGSRDGVRFVFRMSGQFTPGGFSARTVTETESIIRYRRTQACRIVADLLGSKTLGTAP